MIDGGFQFITNRTVFNHLWIDGEELSADLIFCIKVKVLSLISFSFGFFSPPNFYSFFHLNSSKGDPLWFH